MDCAIMIDNQGQVERLLRKLTEALAADGFLNPALMANCRSNLPHTGSPSIVRSPKSLYGRRGRRHVHLVFDKENKEQVFLASITHLAFDRKLPVAREIGRTRNIASSRLDASIERRSRCLPLKGFTQRYVKTWREGRG